MLATHQGLSRGDGLELSSFWRSSSQSNPRHPSHTYTHLHTRQLLSGCPVKAQLICFECQLCHLSQETLE